MTQSPALMWFRDDLRLRDNAALAAAAEHGPVHAIYVLEDPTATGLRALGGAARWWLHHSLAALGAALAEHDIPLTLRFGDPRTLIPQLAEEIGAGYVAWSRRYHRPQQEIDAEVKQTLIDARVGVHSFPGYLLAEPWEINTGQGKPYQVFTPFSKNLRGAVEESAPPPTYATLTGPGADPDRSREQLDALALLPTHPSAPEPDWTAGLHQAWTPGEEGALSRLRDFLEVLHPQEMQPGYSAGRDLPARPATSRLSPHLRFGEISPRMVWGVAGEEAEPGEDAAVFQSELMWRDFAWHRLHHRPDLATVNVRPGFNAFPWAWEAGELAEATRGRRDGRHSAGTHGPGDFRADLSAWRSGTTGIPLVDAGMRELWETGHMHNRVRMVVASLLTKNLAIHWRHGEEWFWDTLVDADPASNAFNWQWVAGSGDDAAPYFRIFNPETQAKRFDPEREYITRWVPEVDTDDYPDPIVDLKESRRLALAAYEQIKG